jgi:transposase-like protein
MFGPKKDVGRPNKFTPERRAAIIDAISHRIPYEYAAEANGICLETLYAWLRTGREHMQEGIVSEYTQFSESLKRAEMTKIREHCDIISARPERWQADAWMLERRWYKHFGPSAQLNELNHKLTKLLGESDESKREEEGGEEG